MLKNLLGNARDASDARFIPWSGRSPGVGNGNLLQCSCLGNSMDRGYFLLLFLLFILHSPNGLRQHFSIFHFFSCCSSFFWPQSLFRCILGALTVKFWYHRYTGYVFMYSMDIFSLYIEKGSVNLTLCIQCRELHKILSYSLNVKATDFFNLLFYWG